MDHKEKLRLAGIKKYGSEEAWRQVMAENGMKGKKTGTGGFHYLKKKNPKRLREISQSGGKNRHVSE